MDVKIPDRSKPQKVLSGVLVFGHHHKDMVEFTVAGVCVSEGYILLDQETVGLEIANRTGSKNRATMGLGSNMGSFTPSGLPLPSRSIP